MLELQRSLQTYILTESEKVVSLITRKKDTEYDSAAQAIAQLSDKRDKNVEAIRNEETALNEELSHLGIFGFRRKKEIRELQEKIPGRIQTIKDEYDRELKLI